MENSKVTHRVAKSNMDGTKRRKEEKRWKKPDKPMHYKCDSLWSWSSGFNDFGGFVNWGFLLLFIGGSRVFLERFTKYGVNFDPLLWGRVLFGDSPIMIVILMLSSNLHVIMSLLIEKGLAGNHLTSNQGLIAQIANLFALTMTPIIIFNIWGTEAFSFFRSTYICLTFFIIFLKLWSYAQVNGWCREFNQLKNRKMSRRVEIVPDKHRILDADPPFLEQVEENPDEVTYPNNLTVYDLYYFMMAPTLCYELNFPRTDRIRKGFLLRRVAELIFGIMLVVALIQQWMIPSVSNSITPFSNMDLIQIAERLLSLAIPNHLIWLIMFYLLFHSYPNIVGEILRFADRDFYQDWWNSPDIETFWRAWNSPVHRWAVRHMYVPAIKATKSKIKATIIVFLFSACFHEYLVSIPLRTFKIWAFCAMIVQLPLILLCKIIGGDKGGRPGWGNVIVWASLILGQPLCILMYYHDYVITHFGQK